MSLAKEGFVYRGQTLKNMLTIPLRFEPKLESFKAGLRDWIKKKIAAKPKFKFPEISTGLFDPRTCTHNVCRKSDQNSNITHC